ncbi:L-dopachrome tautomerase-related protein [Cupriavidus plantarum]|uniref:L-dopachrome tautomerase-related protein n=1 Tax=Cupriavidus plantarum TaxID=942865 RepID=UPI001BA53CCD|nr:L-dopachrome tautomerase-related protein [Cupriavidus plantarum]
MTTASWAAPVLEVVAESDSMIWNAVAVDDDDRIYVAGPRWTGSRGPSVASVASDGTLMPFPDAAWNADGPSDPTETRFVNVNALRRDGKGQLWIVDTGVSGFGGTVLPRAAKLVVVDLGSGRVVRVIPLGPDVARTHSYIDDIRFHGEHAYLTDAGDPGLIVLDIRTGSTRRVLDGARATTAPADRPIIIDGRVLLGADGGPLRVHADPLEVSADGRWLYFGPLEGPWSRIETRWLDDPAMSADQLAGKVLPWRDLPPMGGSVMDPSGNIVYSDLASNALIRISPEGDTQTVIVDSRLHWVDAPAFDSRGRLYLPVPQLDRIGLFNGGEDRVRRPVRLYRLDALPWKTMR